MLMDRGILTAATGCGDPAGCRRLGSGRSVAASWAALAESAAASIAGGGPPVGVVVLWRICAPAILGVGG